MFSARIRNIAHEGFLACFKLVCESVKIQPVRFSLAQEFRQNSAGKRRWIFSQASVLPEKFKFQGWSETFERSFVMLIVVPYTESHPSDGHSPDPMIAEWAKTIFVKKQGNQ